MATIEHAIPFGGNAEKVNLISGENAYTFSEVPVGYSLIFDDGSYIRSDFYMPTSMRHTFGYRNKLNTGDMYFTYGNANGYGVINGKTIQLLQNSISGVLIAYFE